MGSLALPVTRAAALAVEPVFIDSVGSNPTRWHGSMPDTAQVEALSPNHVAERVGFEPTEACASTVFKTAAFDHSATSPERGSIAKNPGSGQ